MEYRHIFCCKM